ncbi:hypothetical protein ABZ442_31000, partial [Streptomyces triculaminicus]|uniref:hypothetical protein n=1 Tax=Streptomyces triculaminicus TaxID=2816232 RepID=UPI00340C52A5
MELDGGGVESSAVVVRQYGGAEFLGDGCDLVGQLPHSGRVTGAGGGAGGGLDEQTALGRE